MPGCTSNHMHQHTCMSTYATTCTNTHARVHKQSHEPTHFHESICNHMHQHTHKEHAYTHECKITHTTTCTNKCKCVYTTTCRQTNARAHMHSQTWQISVIPSQIYTNACISISMFGCKRSRLVFKKDSWNIYLQVDKTVLFIFSWKWRKR